MFIVSVRDHRLRQTPDQLTDEELMIIAAGGSLDEPSGENDSLEQCLQGSGSELA